MKKANTIIRLFFKLSFSILLFYGFHHNLKAQEIIILNDPGGLTEFRNRSGQTFKFRITGTDAGSVWGGVNGIYTDDSRLAKAAVHAGILKIGEAGAVTVTIFPGQASYAGNTQNGISTASYGSWVGSYRFTKSTPENLVSVNNSSGANIPGDPGGLTEYRNKNS
jgi:hypothetical protein